MPIENPTHHTCCTCGYTWLHGQHGGHSCAQVMEVTVADLRARLAKYEDAEGRPLQPAADLVKRIDKAITEFTSGRACMHVPPRDTDVDIVLSECLKLANALESQAREIERLKGDLRNAFDTDLKMATLRDQELEIAALKAQPIGVVLPERWSVPRPIWKDVRQPYGDPLNKSDIEAAEKFNLALDEVARLNSSPVSSGDPEKCSYQDDPRSPAELSLAGCNCVRFGEGNPHWPCKLHTPVSACGVDERAAFEAWYLGHFYMGDKQCGLEWLSTEPCGGYRHQHPAEQWIVWQARAALSAPSHGEQVRDGSLSRESLTLAYRLITKELETLANGSAIDRFKSAQDEFRSAIAAAPSAGSQGGDV